jgi:hypothetical protein
MKTTTLTPLTDAAFAFDPGMKPAKDMRELEWHYNDARRLLDRVHHQLTQGERVYPNSFLAEDIAKFMKESTP